MVIPLKLQNIWMDCFICMQKQRDFYHQTQSFFHYEWEIQHSVHAHKAEMKRGVKLCQFAFVFSVLTVVHNVGASLISMHWKKQYFGGTMTPPFQIMSSSPKILWQQESIPVGCVPPALDHTGGRVYLTETPLDWDQLDRDPPRTEIPPDRDPQTETPVWSEDPTGQRPPEQNDRQYKNITLPQTSFVGGKDDKKNL